MNWRTNFSAVSLIAMAAGGCTTPFAQDTGPDRKAYNAPGSIAISDGKLYGRELLVNERREDVEWINGQVKASETATFTPEIVREIEQISSFAAALGLKVDPAAGLNFRRDKEIGNIQQEIAVERVKLELEQLQRDAELFRAKLPEQTAPVNTNLGQASNATVADATNGVSAAAADQLTKAIDRLLPALTARLDKTDSPLARTATGVSINPYDQFRDRSDLRDALKSERNAATLDELHDYGGSALYRVNFLATVFPDPKYLRSMGVVQLTPVGDKPGEIVAENFLRQWVQHNNAILRDPNRSNSMMGDTALRLLEQRGYLQRLFVETGSGPDCRGIVGNASISIKPGCEGVYILFPVVADLSGEETDFAKAFEEIEQLPDNDRFRPFARAKGILSMQRNGEAGAYAAWRRDICRAGSVSDPNLGIAIDFARSLRRNLKLYDAVQAVIADAGYSAGALSMKVKLAEEARTFLALIDSSLKDIDECKGTSFSIAANDHATPFWGKLSERFTADAKGVRVYDIGPREKSQQISTAARSANSLALAASFAASAPGSGVAGEAAASYSRQAIGRAQALERIPSVIGYASVGSNTDTNASTPFGWVFGPRSRVDPKGRIRTEQAFEEHDLSVDLIAPRWRTELVFKARSVWGPSSTELANGAVTGGTERIVRVKLTKNAADFGAYTEYLLGPLVAFETRTISTGLVNGCSPSFLTVLGHNLWRTTQVIVMGQLIEGGDVRVLPSMEGILIKVPKVTLPKGSLIEPKMALLSPNGVTEARIDYQAEPSGDACGAKPASAVAATDDKAPKISAFTPGRLEFMVPSKFTIGVSGQNLTAVDAVLLHGQKGELKKEADGKSLSVTFTTETSSAIPAPDLVKLEFRKGSETIHSALVRTQKSGGQ